MIDPMEYFRRDSADIYETASAGGYDGAETETFIKTIKCDVQPYGGDMAARERGYAQTETIKLFCAADDEIKRGRFVKTGGKRYIVTDVRKWRMGYEAIAERRDVQ